MCGDDLWRISLWKTWHSNLYHFYVEFLFFISIFIACLLHVASMPYCTAIHIKSIEAIYSNHFKPLKPRKITSENSTPMLQFGTTCFKRNLFPHVHGRYVLCHIHETLVIGKYHDQISRTTHSIWWRRLYLWFPVVGNSQGHAGACQRR